MSRVWIFSLALAVAAQLAAQSPAGSKDITIQVSPAQSWVDTGLDLQAGDVVKISASQASSAPSACNPGGVPGGANDSGGLPLPGAAAGALIARLHGVNSVPVLVGAERELQIAEPSHLFLGMNVSGKAACQGDIPVKIHKLSNLSASTATGSGEQKSRGQQLKSQLASAAQVFMQGQFGVGKTEAAASNAASSTSSSGTEAVTSQASLKISDTPLDAELRKHLDGLPRRVNDQFNNLGDMVNFVIVGSQKDVQSALEAATWHVADTSNTMAVVNAAVQTYGSKDYLAMPMSTLFLFGRKQDFGYEMAEPIAMVASRHHFRIWKAPFTWKDHEVWVGAGTHDIGFAKDRRNNNVTHKIDPAVDGERDNIASSLQKANIAKSMTYYLPANPVQEAKNATGDSYHSDGRLLVIFLQ
jgi:LssY C-terminus